MPCRMYAYVHANLWRGFLFGGISARRYLAGLFTWRDIGPDIWRGFLLDPHSVGAINDDDD